MRKKWLGGEGCGEGSRRGARGLAEIGYSLFQNRATLAQTLMGSGGLRTYIRIVLGRPQHKPRLSRLQQSPAGAVSFATRRGGPAINADRAGRDDTQRRWR